MLEIWSVAATTAGVLVALGLGVYGIFRDRSAEAAIAREQALQVFLTREWAEDPDGEMRRLVVTNTSQKTITDVVVRYWKISTREHDAGEEVETSSTASIVLPGASFETWIHWSQMKMSEGRLSVEFTDAKGVRWLRPLGGALARKR